MNDLFEVWCEKLELVLLTRFQPARLGAGGSLCKSRDERHGRGNSVIALTPHFPQIGDLPVDKALGIGLGPVQKSRDTRGRQQSVILGFEGSELFSANIRASARHHHRRVPTQERQSSAKRVQASKFLLELLVRGG